MPHDRPWIGIIVFFCRVGLKVQVPILNLSAKSFYPNALFERRLQRLSAPHMGVNVYRDEDLQIRSGHDFDVFGWRPRPCFWNLT